jgi:alanine dehydrogenase
MPEVLILNDSEVRETLPVGDAIDTVERAFKEFAEGKATMPAKIYLDFPQHSGDLRIMPASLGSTFAGVKIVNSHPSNPERGLPAVVGTYLLVSQETGMPFAILDATYLTAVRTGAASAVATRAMARKDSSSLGLVGSGVQARFQFEALSEVMSVGEVYVWGPSKDVTRRDRFLAEMRTNHRDHEWQAADDVADACKADVVCTTTPSRQPLVLDPWVSAGTHLNAVGADGPGKQELDPSILKRARVIVDEWEQAKHGGEINVPLSRGEINDEDVAGSLADVVSGRIPGRTAEDEVTVFDSTGLAIEDIAVASMVYQRALEDGLGTRLDL